MTAGGPATAIPQSKVDRRRLWFGLDAAVTGLNGLGYLVFADRIAPVLGVAPALLVGVGLFLVLVTVPLIMAARAPEPRPADWLPVIINLAWVVASIVFALAAAEPSLLGRGWVLVQAAVVGVFATLQFRSLRR
ncbi:hypothetical protein GCM10028864_39320 [Microlunatus parietis]